MYQFFLNLIGFLLKKILIYLGPIYIKLGTSDYEGYYYYVYLYLNSTKSN